MIIWLASYPKNGNTWLRSLIGAYYYTKDGIFLGDNHLKNVQQFPVKKYLESFDYDLAIPGDTSRFWVLAQEKINEERTIKFFKTHNALVKLGNNDFTNRANSLGGIYIVRDPRNVITSIMNHFEMKKEEALNFMPPTMKQTNWRTIIQQLLDSVSIIEVSQDVSIQGQFMELLESFCTERAQAQSRDEILLGKPWTEEGKTYFRLKDLIDYCKTELGE